MRNSVKIDGDTAYIQLDKGKTALVDVADLPKIEAHGSWHSRPDTRGWYARSGSRGSDGKVMVVTMHRIVMAAPKGTMIDHKNGNGLDNRRSNLRFCTNAENQFNQRPQIGRASQYKGVWRGYGGRWVAHIRHKGKQKYLGTYDTQEDAARAYDVAAQIRFGEFARLNNPPL